jgi:hypothetical protein
MSYTPRASHSSDSFYTSEYFYDWRSSRPLS